MKIIYEYENVSEALKKLEELLAYTYHPDDDVEVKIVKKIMV